jgi:hypothetical protein
MSIENGKIFVAMVAQVVLLYGVRPIVSFTLRMLNWCVRNIWFFLCILLLAVFYFERIGMSAEIVPERVREVLVMQFPIGWFVTPPVYEMVVGLFVFTIVLFVYMQVKEALRELLKTVKAFVSFTVLFGMYLYYRARGIKNDEFVVLEEVFTITAIFKFMLILLIMFSPGLMFVGVHTLSHGTANDLVIGQLTTNTTPTYENVTLIDVGGYRYNVTVEDPEMLPRSYPILINLTTGAGGYNLVNVSSYIDNVFVVVDNEVNTYAICH